MQERPAEASVRREADTRSLHCRRSIRLKPVLTAAGAAPGVELVQGTGLVQYSAG